MLLTASLLFAGMTTTFAQVPDASGWKEGDDITDKVNWGNLSFMEDDFSGAVENPHWHFESSAGGPLGYEEHGPSFAEFGFGVFECFNGADEDLYQYVELPAGMYRLECQAYYRFGTAWADDPAAFGTAEWKDNAMLYASNGIYDTDSKEFTAGRTFQTPLMPRIFPKQTEPLYTTDETDWKNDGGPYTIDGENIYYGPSSVPGTLRWFAAGLYGPYDDGEGTKYNTVTFFLTQDGYARVGITKKDAKEADSFMATNFKLYYEGPADEAVELMALQDEVQQLYDRVVEIADNNEGLLYTLVNDWLGDVYDSEYGPASSMDKETCIAAKAVLGEFYQKANAAAGYIANIKTAVNSANDMIAIVGDKASAEGLAAYKAAIEEANSCLDPNYEIQDDDTLDKFANAYEALLNARMPFLLSQEKENGRVNLSPVINKPFFCDAQYTPAWSDEANAYVFPTVPDVADELQPENTWATIQEQGYAEARDANSDWIPICEDFTYSSADTENQWVIISKTWHGGSIGITMQHSYPAIGGWTAEPTGDPELVYQTITNLPDGFYSMSALMCNAGADISPLQYVYIESGESKEIANLTMKGNPWWGGNKENWRSTVWEELSTSMIRVVDGKVTIGAASDAFYAVTGFQLYYYGETPDYASLIISDIEAAKESVSNLAWLGDQTAANAIMAELPAEITTEEAFIKAKEVVAKVKDYVAKANAAVSAYAAVTNFEALAGKYEEGSDENELLNTAWAYAIGVGDNDTDTYLDAIAADAAYAAYADYLAYREGFGEYLEDEGIKAAIAEQNNILKANYQTAEQVKALKEALALPYNTAVLASLGSDKASEKNPVDVTALIVNPSFDEGKTTGWDGTMTPDTIGVAECYNRDFDVSQTIYSLPAGCYRVQCQAFYRDGGDANTAYKNWWNNALGEMELWETANEIFYANEAGVKVQSLASILPTEMSYTKYVEKWEEIEEDAEGNMQYAPVWKEWTEADGYNHPWDQKVEDGEEVYFYPNSIRGACRRFEANPEAYINTVEVMVEEGGKLTFGLKNTDLIGNHWTVFDNFKLFYLGKDIPSGMTGTAANDAQISEVYTVSGVRVNGMQKGISIIKMNDGSTRKVVK